MKYPSSYYDSPSKPTGLNLITVTLVLFYHLDLQISTYTHNNRKNIYKIPIEKNKPKYLKIIKKD